MTRVIIKRPRATTLRRQYVTDEMTITAMAEHYSVSTTLVRTWLIQCNIELRAHRKADRDANYRLLYEREHQKLTKARQQIKTLQDKLEFYQKQAKKLKEIMEL